MGIGSSDGNFYENDFEFARGRPRVYIQSDNVEDRTENDPYKRAYSGPEGDGIAIDPPDNRWADFKDFWTSYPAARYTSNPMAQDLGYNDINKLGPVDYLEMYKQWGDLNDPFRGGQIPQDIEPARRDIALPPAPAPETGVQFASVQQPSAASGMPLGGSTEPAGALFSQSGGKVPGNASKEEIRPTPDYMNPPERESSFRPRMTGILSGLWDSIKGAASFTQTPAWAQDPKTGEYHTNPIAIERAANLAELMTFGPGVMVGKAADGTLGSFIGAKAKTWDKNNYALANILEKRGADKEEILLRTGMFRGVDKKWRTEISDADAIIDQEALKFHPVKTQAQRDLEDKLFEEDPFRQIPFDAFEGTSVANLEDFYKHPKLYEAYPSLKDARIVEDLNFNGIAQAEESGVIRYNPERLAASGLPLKDIVAHEVQHLIQGIEGFSRGGGPVKVEEGLYRLKHQLDDAQIGRLQAAITRLLTKFKQQGLDEVEFEILTRADKILDTHKRYIKAADYQAYENYLRLAGEAEARNVQTRLLLRDDDLRYYHPFESMDVPADKQILVNQGTAMTAYGKLGAGGRSIPIPP